MNDNDKPQRDYYPHKDWEDKLAAYKQGITESLHYACHPDHLDIVQRRLDNLRRHWREEWELDKPKENNNATKTTA